MARCQKFFAFAVWPTPHRFWSGRARQTVNKPPAGAAIPIGFQKVGTDPVGVRRWWNAVGKVVLLLAKLSVSIPDDLKELLDARSESEGTPVSHLVTDALRAYFAQPAEEERQEVPSPTPPAAGSSEEIRQIQEYLWDLHQSYERTRSSVLVLYETALQGGNLAGIPPESSFKKPPWPKPRPRPSSP